MEKTHRAPELAQYKSIWVTEEAYKLLRQEKRKKKKSMMKIVDELIKKNLND